MYIYVYMNNVYFCQNICIKIHNYILGHKDSTNLKRVVSYADKQHQHPSPKFLRQQSCQWTSRQTECRQNFYFMSNVDGDDTYARRDTHSFSKINCLASIDAQVAWKPTSLLRSSIWCLMMAISKKFVVLTWPWIWRCAILQFTTILSSLMWSATLHLHQAGKKLMNRKCGSNNSKSLTFNPCYINLLVSTIYCITGTGGMEDSGMFLRRIK